MFRSKTKSIPVQTKSIMSERNVQTPYYTQKVNFVFKKHKSQLFNIPLGHSIKKASHSSRSVFRRAFRLKSEKALDHASSPCIYCSPSSGNRSICRPFENLIDATCADARAEPNMHVDNTPTKANGAPLLKAFVLRSPIDPLSYVNEIITAQSLNETMLHEKKVNAENGGQDNANVAAEVPYESQFGIQFPRNIDNTLRKRLERAYLRNQQRQEDEKAEMEAVAARLKDVKVAEIREKETLMKEEHKSEEPASEVRAMHEPEGSMSPCGTGKTSAEIKRNMISDEKVQVPQTLAPSSNTDSLSQSASIGEEAEVAIEVCSLDDEPQLKVQPDNAEHLLVPLKGVFAMFALSISAAAVAKMCLKVK